MAVYVPTVHTAVLLAAMFEQKTIAALLAAGVLDPDTLADAVKAGDAVDIPQLDPAADFERASIGSTTPLSPTHVSTTDDKAVVLRDVSVNEFYDHDLIRAGESLDQRLSRSVGGKLAKRLVKQLFNVLEGAIAAADTPETDCHVEDQSGVNMTVDIIRAAKQRLGDEADMLSTLCIHSLVWGDLLSDLIANYKIDVVGGQIINNGKLQNLLGLSNIIVTDQVNIVPAGDDPAVYSTCLLGPLACYFAYQRDPQTETARNVLNPSTANIVKTSMDYVLHLRGIKWTGSTNPTDVALANASNWDIAYTDHRQVRAVKILSGAAIPPTP